MKCFAIFDIHIYIFHKREKLLCVKYFPTIFTNTCFAIIQQVASIIHQKQKSNPKDPFASNWLERLRQIKRIRSKVKPDTGSTPSAGGHANRESPGIAGGLNMIDDFTDFVS
jgi:hypothetical protein